MSKPSLVQLSAFVLCLSSAAAWASPGTVLRNDRLYTQPSSSATVAATVARGTAVNILSKKGGWVRVTAGRTTGWMRLLSVRAGEGGVRGAGVGDVFGAATTRSDPSRVVAVAGLRGLNDEDLKLAKFNPEEIARLEAIDVSAAQVNSFARQRGLASVSVPSLPEPRPERSDSPWENN